MKCGDSLVGVGDLVHLNEGIPDGAYRPIEGDDKAAATSYRKRNAAERGGQLVFGHTPAETAEWAEDFKTFAILEERNPDEVQAKGDLYAQLRNLDTRWGHAKAACDLWTYTFFAPLQPTGPDGLDGAPTTNDLRNALAGHRASTPLFHAATAAAETHRFFHWPLEFPDVFERGGFDVVLGNPPWERIKLQEKEFFAGRDDDIADAPKKADRQRLIRHLDQHNPGLAREFAEAKHTADSQSRFVRGSARFPLAGRGDVNTYSVFAETCRRVMHPTGRGGIIVPSGIATDDTTKVLFAELVNSGSLVSLFDFENREGVFPGVHRSYKFCLLTLTGSACPSDEAEFAFFLHRAEHLQDATRRFVLAKEDFELFNPNTRTCPIFRTRRDAEIAGKMYRRAGVFWKEARGDDMESNPWGTRFLRMFDMSNDSGLFRTREQLAGAGWRLESNIFVRGDTRYLPLYEAKLIHQFDHRFATFDGVSEADLRSGNAKEVADTEKSRPEFVILPRYWVPEKEVARRLDRPEDMGKNNRPASQPLDLLSELAHVLLSGRSRGQPTSERGSSR